MRKLQFVMSFKAQEETYDIEVNFKHFQTLEEYDSKKEYCLLYSDEYYCFDVYEILPK